MRFKKDSILLISTLVIIVAVLHSRGTIKAEASQINDPCQTLKERLKRLEPETPKNINDPPGEKGPFPTSTYPISEIIKKGTEIPLDLAYSNPNWKRQSYKSYWHSTVAGGRWSYVPIRISYAMHRLFTTYPTASIYYDFIHDLGIEEESSEFKRKDEGPFDYINTVVMQGQVRKIVTYGNQVLIIVKPQKNGLQVLDIPVNKIKPINEKENILFQLVTEQGDEIDHSLITFIRPNQR
jgi:hypothetical protein